MRPAGAVRVRRGSGVDERTARSVPSDAIPADRRRSLLTAGMRPHAFRASSRCRLAVALVLAVAATGCAARASQRERPLGSSASPLTGRVFVMAPIVGASAFQGNVGKNGVDVRATVAARTLAAVKERFASARIVDADPAFGAAMPGTSGPAAGSDVVMLERSAAREAHDAGATHLLVPTVVEWREMRTDDPIGAVILPHNRVTITLRLIRLEPPALVASATFSNSARLTVNQHASSLLNDRFRRTVLQLLSGAAQ
jgi:hypothetical protein